MSFLGIDWPEMVQRWKKLEKITKADIVAFAQTAHIESEIQPEKYGGLIVDGT